MSEPHGFCNSIEKCQATLLTKLFKRFIKYNRLEESNLAFKSRDSKRTKELTNKSPNSASLQIAMTMLAGRTCKLANICLWTYPEPRFWTRLRKRDSSLVHYYWVRCMWVRKNPNIFASTNWNVRYTTEDYNQFKRDNENLIRWGHLKSLVNKERWKGYQLALPKSLWSIIFELIH